jgi:hypothetical protein
VSKDEIYEVAKTIYEIDNGNSNFSDPDGEKTEFIQGAILFAAKHLNIDEVKIYDEVLEISQAADKLHRAENKMQYDRSNPEDDDDR